MRDESYTFEDYIKDFEFDYLGFDGIPDKPVSDFPSKKITGNEPGQAAENFDKNPNEANLHFQKVSLYSKVGRI